MAKGFCDLCKWNLEKPIPDKWLSNIYLTKVLIKPGGFFSSHIIDTYCDDCADSLNKKYGGKDEWSRDATSAERLRYPELLLRIPKDNFKKDYLNLDKLKNDVYVITRKRREENKRYKKHQAERKLKAENAEKDRIELLKKSIIQLLRDNQIKMPTSDINAHLKHKHLDEIKEVCEELYDAGEISFAGNGRYFILSEETKKPKKVSEPKPEAVDVEKELEKFKGMLDKGLINQEDYDVKKKELLGL